MEWSTFLTWLGGGYFMYYLVVILLDVFFQKQGQQPDETAISYDIKSLLEEDEVPTKVDHSYVSPPNAQELFNDEEKNVHQEVTPLKVKSEPVQEIKPDPKPVTPITESKQKEEVSFDRPPEGQGIPLKEFLKNARQQSSKIQFS